MSKKWLEKAPLVLVQAQFYFSDLPSPSLVTEQELESLHKALIKLGFVEKIDTELVELGFEMSEEAHDGYIQIKQQKNNIKRLVFRGFNKTQSVEFMSNRITVKNTDYKHYDQFVETIKNILDVFTKNVSDLENVLMKQVSIRYIDVVLPSENYELKDYICPDLLPFHPTFSKKTIGMSQSIVKTDGDSFMIIVTEEVETNNYPGRWLPVDMLESDERAVLLLKPYLDKYQQGKNYAILNIDHRVDFPNTPKWEQTNMLEKLDSLYDLSSQFFWEVITDTAKTEWGMQDE